jgi:hypothetical protein
MFNHLRYLRRVLWHKLLVLGLGWVVGLPLRTLLVHDLSKFSKAEWSPYVNKFFGGPYRTEAEKERVNAEFRQACEHHVHENPHHWEHWLDATGEPTYMPPDVAREMVVDWAAAGRAITGRWDLAEWYAANRNRIKLHPVTRNYVTVMVWAIHGALRGDWR